MEEKGRRKEKIIQDIWFGVRQLNRSTTREVPKRAKI
jgi:hypothetical protein